MENIIYVHLDYSDFTFSYKFNTSNFVYSELPEYAEISINQSKKLFRNVYIVKNDDVRQTIEDLYLELEYSFPMFIKDPFWFFTLARLYALNCFVIANNIDKFIHLEYDNIIYYNHDFRELKEGIYFTKVGPGIGSAGLLYCNGKKHLQSFINSISDLVSIGQQEAMTRLGTAHLYEMEFIDFFIRRSSNITNKFYYLPLFPEDEFFDECKMLFDGASYGQYLGGTNNGHGKGWYGKHHYLGKRLEMKELNVCFDSRPYLIMNKTLYPIFNLHIHSKNLKDFI